MTYRNTNNLDKIRGSLIGGAAGDALGYAVEFWAENRIFHTYGKKGITEYELTKGKAIISDDTQMTLFTANGILVGKTRGCVRGIMGPLPTYVEKAYEDWYLTQKSSYTKVNKHKRYTAEGGTSWLLDIPELFVERAPGITCLNALYNDKSRDSDYINDPINNSKGCGGIMRVAPAALHFIPDVNEYEILKKLDMDAAQMAAITHSHPLGYMPAAVFSHIISRIMMDRNNTPLKEIVEDARDTVSEIFSGNEHLQKQNDIINLALQLTENNDEDLTNIHRLGEGWVAEEALGIALYCALKYSDDFSAAMIAAVNHKGDSDSTGAIAGNIVGALVGYDAIDEKWKKDLELHDVILEIADDLYKANQINECVKNPAWEKKYIEMHRVND